MRKLFLFLTVCLSLWIGSAGRCQPGIHNVQAIPTPELWLAQRSSFDALDHYTPGFFLQGLNAFDPAHLGCHFAGPYVSRQAFFGVLVDDQLTSYTAPINLAGLNGGDNWTTVYVVHHPWAPSLAWDLLTNSTYTATTSLAGLNGGDNDGGSVSWNGPYVVDPCNAAAGPTFASYKGAIVMLINCTVPGCAQYTMMFFTVDGSTPNPAASHGDINAAQSWPPSGTYTYTGAFTLAGGGVLNLQAVQADNSGNCPSAVSTNSYRDFGQNWSNNVVANGGAAPSSANVAIVNNCGLQLNTNQLLEASFGAYPTVRSLNLFMPDNLIAALTPQIYDRGSQPWVNHNFVSGDLTINGLIGDASTKYLDTGFDVQSYLGINSSAIAVYAFSVGGAGGDSGTDLGFLAGGLLLAASQSGISSFGQVQCGSGNRITVATKGAGFYCTSRTSSTRYDLYFANSGTAWSSIGNNTSTANATWGAAGNLFAFAYNNGGSPGGFPGDRLSCAAIMSDGYNSSQGQKLFNTIQSVRTQLGGGEL